MTNETIRRPIPKPERQDPPLTTRTEPAHRPICADCGSRDHAEHPAAEHVHDLALTISAGDVPNDLFPLLRETIAKEVEAALARINADMEPLGVTVWSHFSYDGSLEHRCQR